MLNTGALPVQLEPAYQQQVSATLGKDSLNQGLIAGLIGLGIVLVYMLALLPLPRASSPTSRSSSTASCCGGSSTLIPVTLTLPGIAGMILTIGVAADANVVIFERIKEEVRHGKTVRSAVNSGYARGFKTILDANILTMLTALRALPVRHGQPKGFAFTLILGVLVSMLTAVLFTRAMLGVLAGFAFFSKPAFMGVKAGQLDIETAVMGDSRAAASRKRRGGATAQPAAEGAPASPPPSRRRRRPSTSTAGGQRTSAGRRTSTSTASARSGDSP